MAPEVQTAARATQTWLRSSWHVQVPVAWLEACVEFLQEEAGGAGRLSQQQINQQALDQWLLTDLRDLDHPVLPEGISQAQKTELNGTFCVQVDSLLDVSQPAYSQLQNWRGTDHTNDEVSAVTQNTQRPWEAKPTRMLLLQVTDGVQSLEAMEYQPIPALSTSIRPGAKLQLKGQMVCRLGVLLLGPSNVKVLGGEVEDLAERNNQGRLLCRTLGLPEEEQPQQQQQEEQEEQGEQEVPPAQQGNQEVDDLELDDSELFASLETPEMVQRIPRRPVRDSGYGTLSEVSTQSSRSSSVRTVVSTASSRSETSAMSHSYSSAQSSRGGHSRNDGNNSDLFHPLPPEPSTQQQIPHHSMADEDFPDEDFDDLPLDELDGEMFEPSADVSSSTHRSAVDPKPEIKPKTYPGTQLGLNNRSVPQKRDYQGFRRSATGGAAELFSKPSYKPEVVTIDEDDFMDVDMDCFLGEVETTVSEVPKPFPAQQEPRDKPKTSSFSSRPCSSSSSTAATERFSSKTSAQSCSSSSALTLTSSPFTYLRLLEERISKHPPQTIQIRVKAFIVTLLGKLTSSGGVWRICATISDGTGYLDVELSDEVLTGLLGFSVTEKAALKRDPTRRAELDAGMRRCQEELVDMCCIMTVEVEPGSRKAVVRKAEAVSERVLQELGMRVTEIRK